MAQSRVLAVAYITATIGLLALIAYGITQIIFGFQIFGPTKGGSPIEVYGGSIHLDAYSGVVWKQISDTQYSATLPNGYTVDQMVTDGVRGVKNPVSIQKAWMVELSNPNYSQAVSICSDPDCSLSTSPGGQIYANLSSANLIWEPISAKGGPQELRFHDKACDTDYPKSKNEGRCDFLSTVTIKDSTFNSTQRPLVSGRCAKVPIVAEGHCTVQIGPPMP
jgi:hypothetical protein